MVAAEFPGAIWIAPLVLSVGYPSVDISWFSAVKVIWPATWIRALAQSWTIAPGPPADRALFMVLSSPELIQAPEARVNRAARVREAWQRPFMTIRN
jgi:hypothetical protein